MGGTTVPKLPGNFRNGEVLVRKHFLYLLDFLSYNELLDGDAPGF